MPEAFDVLKLSTGPVTTNGGGLVYASGQEIAAFGLHHADAAFHAVARELLELLAEFGQSMLLCKGEDGWYVDDTDDGFLPIGRHPDPVSALVAGGRWKKENAGKKQAPPGLPVVQSVKGKWGDSIVAPVYPVQEDEAEDAHQRQGRLVQEMSARRATVCRIVGQSAQRLQERQDGASRMRLCFAIGGILSGLITGSLIAGAAGLLWARFFR